MAPGPASAHSEDGDEQIGVVLVVGAPGAGKATLLRALLAGGPAPPDAAAAGTAPGPPRLRLDTKYYTAEAAVAVLRLTGGGEQGADVAGGAASAADHAAGASGADGGAPMHPTAHAPDAVVAVADAANPGPSLAAVARWAASPAGEAACSGAAVKLLVLTKADAARRGGHRSAAAEAAEWALDNGFECVEAAAGAPEVDVTLGADGDRQGVARVREALEVHMWPGLALKRQQPRRQGPEREAPAQQQQQQQQEQQQQQQEQQQQQQQQEQQQQQQQEQQQGLAGQQRRAVSTTADAAAAAGTRGLGGPDAGAGAAAQPTAGGNGAAPAAAGEAAGAAGLGAGARGGEDAGGSGGGGGGAGGGDDGDMAAVESFEELMQQLNGARERLSKLPDAERRAQAAALALRFASLLGGSDDEEGEGSE